MDRILVFACALGLLAGGAPAHGQEPYRERTTLAEDSLAGPVRSVETRRRFTAAGRNGGPSRPYEQVVRVAYDREGRRTEYVVADSGVLVDRMVYAYDDRGRNTGYTRFAARGQVQRVAYSYDAGGRLVGMDNTGEITGRFRYVRDDAGRLLESVHEGGPRMSYRYDERGRRVEEVYRMADGTVLGTARWEHGPAGPVRETRTDGGGLVRRVHEMRYDAEGRLVERTTRETNAVRGLSQSHAPVPGRETFSYRDGGRTVETESFAPDGTPRGRKVERFDARGRIVEVEKFGPDGAPEPAETFSLDDAGRLARTVRGVERWSYDDDRHGNWTRKRWLIAPAG
ncbi:MAG TPA: hypothetical protein VFQ76_16380, partial [Longimicrobiaceae bacterium]|nr:hypothetical protein [Longimicrobiaceae bacterium]